MQRHKPSGPGHRVTVPKPVTGPRKTDWNAAADWYDELVGDDGTEFQQKIILPGMIRLLDVQPRQRILDVACGQGVLCRALHDRGCEVTGIDAAPALIDAAIRRGPAEIRYQVGDARDMPATPPATFDAAACMLAIQNIHPTLPVFENVARILKDRGRFVIVMMHPCFRGPKETHWGWDDAKKVQYRRVDRYLMPRKEPIVTHPGSAPDAYTWTFHKPIETYVKALRQAGLLIDALEEWSSHKRSDSGPRAGAENVARKEIPMFLAIRAVKILGVISQTPPMLA